MLKKSQLYVVTLQTNCIYLFLIFFFIDNKITEEQGKVTDITIEAPTNYHGSLNGLDQVVSL